MSGRLRVLSNALQQQQQQHTLNKRRLFSNYKRACSFGIAFDIDGVILLGHNPIGGSSRALKRLYDDHSTGALKIPFVFLTNGGGFRESVRASELTQLLGVNISPLQVLQGHSPFKHLVNEYENDLVVALGKGETAAVMSEYGFKNVLSIDEYASYFENIDPLAPYKKWVTKRTTTEMSPKIDVHSQKVKAAFVVSDPVDWSRDIQVLSDILRTGGLPGKGMGHQPDLFFSHDDLEYQANFPTGRFGLGAFRIAFESVFNCIHPHALKYVTFGKPNPVVFRNAENALTQLKSSLHHNLHVPDHSNAGIHNFKTLYMIGDNPKVDIKGAHQAGQPWFSILTRTGVFKGKQNHAEFPADLVVDTVEDAVDYILKKELA
ncbi:hypothetical protein ACFE04_006120 [Oxalis oulophora]